MEENNVLKTDRHVMTSTPVVDVATTGDSRFSLLVGVEKHNNALHYSNATKTCI